MINTINVLKALSDETRLRILNLLYDQELCVCDLMEVLAMSQPKVSRHLGYMKNAGLVSDRKQAQWVHYSLIRHEDGQFIDALVKNNLRAGRQYQEDLKRYAEWIEVKGKACK